MVCQGRDLKDHLVPARLPLDQVAEEVFTQVGLYIQFNSTFKLRGFGGFGVGDLCSLVGVFFLS